MVSAPEIYELWGESILGPWENLEPEIQQGWLQLAADVAEKQGA